MATVQRRTDIVDASKGLGILLMVIGHSGCPQWLHDFIYVFHMPLFFFLSGYCLKEYYLDNKALFVRKRMQRIYWTFLKWNIVFFALNQLFFSIGITNEHYPLDSLPHIALGLLTMGTWHELLGPYWFLRYLLLCSFAVVFVSAGLRRYPKLCHALFLLMPVLPTALYILGYDSLKGQGLLCCFFYYCGFILRDVQPHFHKLHFSFALALTVTASLFVKTEIPSMQPQLTLVYAIAAVCGIYATTAACTWLFDRQALISSTLAAIGRQTLTILTWHLLAFKIVSAAIIGLWHIPADNMYGIIVDNKLTGSYTWIAYTIVGMAVPLALKAMSEKWKRSET